MHTWQLWQLPLVIWRQQKKWFYFIGFFLKIIEQHVWEINLNHNLWNHLNKKFTNKNMMEK